MLALPGLTLTLTALALSALSVAGVHGAPSLSLRVQGASSISALDVDTTLKVNTTLTNTGDETLRVLNDPNSALSTLPADTFAVTNTNINTNNNPKGRTAKFTGIKVKYVPRIAAAAGAFTVLKPGACVSVTHDLTSAYDLASTGAGTYTIAPSPLFHIVSSTGDISVLRADVGGDVHRVSVSASALASVYAFKDRVAKATAIDTRNSEVDNDNTTPNPQRRTFLAPAPAPAPVYVNCTAPRQAALGLAVNAAQAYAADGKRYLASARYGPEDVNEVNPEDEDANTLTTGPRYTTWFGPPTDARRGVVESAFTAISKGDFGAFTYDCTCSDSGTFAYVYPNTPGKIYLCGAFWSAPTTGTDSKGGTLIHESSHFTLNGGTGDYVYGQAGAKNLAATNPDRAVHNADSYEYFAENSPVLG